MPREKFAAVSFFIILFLSACLTVQAGEIPLDAERHMARGEAAVEGAQSTSDYEDAVKEFNKAIELAPDWPNAYYNLAVAQEGAGWYGEAIKSLKRYMELAPDAEDAKDVQKKIFKLEYMADKATSEKKAKAESAISGMWTDEVTKTGRYRIDVDGNSFEIIYLGSKTNPGIAKNDLRYYGTIRGNNLRGTWVLAETLSTYQDISGTGNYVECTHPAGEHPVTGVISQGGNKIDLKAVVPSLTPGASSMNPGFTLIKER